MLIRLIALATHTWLASTKRVTRQHWRRGVLLPIEVVRVTLVVPSTGRDLELGCAIRVQAGRGCADRLMKNKTRSWNGTAWRYRVRVLAASCTPGSPWQSLESDRIDLTAPDLLMSRRGQAWRRLPEHLVAVRASEKEIACSGVRSSLFCLFAERNEYNIL